MNAKIYPIVKHEKIHVFAQPMSEMVHFWEFGGKLAEN